MICADARTDANGDMQDSSEAVEVLRKSLEEVRGLAASARAGNATLNDEEDPESLPPIHALERLAKVLQAQQIGGEVQAADSGTARIQGGAGRVTAYDEPHVQFNAPAGIAQYTPATANMVAGETLTQAAHDVNWSVGKTLFAGAASGLVLYAQGKRVPTDTTGSPPGLRLHAATGKACVSTGQAALALARG